MPKRILYIKGYKLDRQKIRTHLNLVLVLEDGYDEAALKASDVQIPETLPQGSLKVLTAGVWLSDEQDDDDDDN